MQLTEDADHARHSSPPLPAEEKPVKRDQSSYGEILKASAWIGGSSLIGVAVGIVRSKVFAILLGPVGFGLLGLYYSFITLAEGIAGMGVNTAGVRQIAAAAGTGRAAAVARTARVLRQTSLGLGVVGALLVLVAARSVSKFTFGSDDRTAAVSMLSLAVLFRTVGAGQGALLQGLRHISDMARSSVLGILFGSLAGMVFVFWFRQNGIVPAIVAMDFGFLMLSWWYSRRIKLDDTILGRRELFREASALLRLGFAFMASGLLATGAAYAVRMMLARQLGLGEAGLFQSAWTVGGLYVGFVLQAMGADFYPRLTAAISDNERTGRLVNEQAQVSILLAAPGVLGTLTFAPLIVPLFYSAAFSEGTMVLRWLCFGVALRVITWPLGFIVMAHARQGLFIAVELAYTVVYMVLAWLGIRRFGLNGSGMAFFASYVFHGLMLYPMVRALSGFHWSKANRRLIPAFLCVTCLVFGGQCFLSPWTATMLGTVALVSTSVASVRSLALLVPAERLPLPFRRVASWLARRRGTP